MYFEALIETRPDTPLEAKAERIGDTHFDLEAQALVDTLDKTRVQEKAETFGDIMGDVKAKRSTRWLKQFHTRRPRHL